MVPIKAAVKMLNNYESTSISFSYPTSYDYFLL
jgi:hypothetical protein